MPKGRTWRLRSLRGKYLLVHKENLLPNEVPLTPGAAWKLLERMLDAPQDASDLASLAAAISTGEVHGSRQLNRTALQRAILIGSLVILPHQEEQPKGDDSRNTESLADQLSNARVAKTWVEMELVDMSGAPVPGKRYICMLPDGNMREGQLDSRGRVRFDGIDPGNCVFAFPELDREAWERIV